MWTIFDQDNDEKRLSDKQKNRKRKYIDNTRVDRLNFKTGNTTITMTLSLEFQVERGSKKSLF